MYVCICNALSEKKVREAANVLGGAATASEIFRSLGSTPQCGKCVSHALNIYREQCRSLSAA